jgi:hypothetical protein
MNHTDKHGAKIIHMQVLANTSSCHIYALDTEGRMWFRDGLTPWKEVPGPFASSTVETVYHGEGND